MREIKGYCRPKQWRTYYKMGSGRFLGLAWHYIEIWFISFLLLLSSSFYYPIDPHAPLLPSSFNIYPALMVTLYYHLSYSLPLLFFL